MMLQLALIKETSKRSFQTNWQTIVKIVRTVRSMLLLLLYRYTPLTPRERSIEDIFNYMAIDEGLVSSGQPTEGQFFWIKAAGYTAIVDLTTDDAIDNTVENEPEIVTGLGLKYFHIPVDFRHPQWTDFEKFVQIMQQLSEDNVWVHCLVNARASAFIFKYRTAILGVDKDEALWDLREVWEPVGPWKEFVYEMDVKR